MGSKINFIAILGSNWALKMSYIRRRAINMHFEGICSVKTELNYPFKVQLIYYNMAFFSPQEIIDIFVKTLLIDFTCVHVCTCNLLWGWMSFPRNGDNDYSPYSNKIFNFYYITIVEIKLDRMLVTDFISLMYSCLHCDCTEHEKGIDKYYLPEIVLIVK